MPLTLPGGKKEQTAKKKNSSVETVTISLDAVCDLHKETKQPTLVVDFHKSCVACPVLESNCGFEKSYWLIVLYQEEIALERISFVGVTEPGDKGEVVYSIYDILPKSLEVPDIEHLLAEFCASICNSLLFFKGGT